MFVMSRWSGRGRALVAALLPLACSREIDRYLATLVVSVPGEEPGRRVEFAARDGVWRVDFRDGRGTAALGWRGKENWILFVGGFARTRDLPAVLVRYGLPDPGDLATVPFARSRWMTGARKVPMSADVGGEASSLWIREASDTIERFWLAERDGVPRRYERSTSDGTKRVTLEWHDVRLGATLPDASFSVPPGTPGLSLPVPGL